MKSIDDNIETLSRAILNEAHTEADQVLAQARAKADEIRTRGLVEAEAERKRILDKASQEVERVRSQAIANARLKARSMQFQRREDLLDRVFASARQQLPGIQTWTNYDKIASRLLIEAVRQLNAPQARVRVDGKTALSLNQQTVQNVAAELKVELDLGQPLEQGIGVIVESDNGRLHYDNTLEDRLDRLQSTLRSPIYKLLNGEQL
jgi:V/A-type H+/Na+-transporting ATPase subunit G/H